jgi:hypothetical protein
MMMKGSGMIYSGRTLPVRNVPGGRRKEKSLAAFCVCVSLLVFALACLVGGVFTGCRKTAGFAGKTAVSGGIAKINVELLGADWDTIDDELQDPAKTVVDLRGQSWDVDLLLVGSPGYQAGPGGPTPYLFNHRRLANGAVNSITVVGASFVDLDHIVTRDGGSIRIIDSPEASLSYCYAYELDFIKDTADGPLHAYLFNCAFDSGGNSGYDSVTRTNENGGLGA